MPPILLQTSQLISNRQNRPLNVVSPRGLRSLAANSGRNPLGPGDAGAMARAQREGAGRRPARPLILSPGALRLVEQAQRAQPLAGVPGLREGAAGPVRRVAVEHLGDVLQAGRVELGGERREQRAQLGAPLLA